MELADLSSVTPGTKLPKDSPTVTIATSSGDMVAAQSSFTATVSAAENSTSTSRHRTICVSASTASGSA